MKARNLEPRITRLEATAVPADRTSYGRIVGRSVSDCDEQVKALIASGQAASTDTFVYRVLVTP